MKNYVLNITPNPHPATALKEMEDANASGYSFSNKNSPQFTDSYFALIHKKNNLGTCQAKKSYSLNVSYTYFYLNERQKLATIQSFLKTCIKF